MQNEITNICNALGLTFYTDMIITLPGNLPIIVVYTTDDPDLYHAEFCTMLEAYNNGWLDKSVYVITRKEP